jgi:acyl-homoserine lactone synthase
MLMIHIVTAENRHLFRHALMQMHLQRKQVFIDELGWRLSAEAGIEIDDYDSEEAIYLLEADAPRAPVTASARLLRTDRPHLLSDRFAHLCAAAPPCGPGVWEATRFCPAPDTPKGAERHSMLGRMIAAIMETTLLFGIERVTFVASAALAPLAKNAGWTVAQLGPERRLGRERLTAMAADIDGPGLRRVRVRNGIGGPLTRFMPGDLARAA